MNETDTMNIAYCTNRDYLPCTLVSLYSLLTAGKGERRLRILLAADRDLSREDLALLYRPASQGRSTTTTTPA